MNPWRSLGLLLLFPVVAFAESSLSLSSQGGEFEQFLKTTAEEQSADDADRILEGSDELFPVPAGAAISLSSAPAPLSLYVIVTVDGVFYELKDVPTTAWFGPFVREAAELRIVSGYRDAQGKPLGLFRPERDVTIEELAKMAIEAAQLEVSGCPATPLNPGAKNTWSTSYISCAEQHSFAVYSDGTVDIHRPATRAEVVMTVLQAFGVEMRETAPVGLSFSDVSASTLFSNAIFTALESGIVSGDTDGTGNLTGTFRPRHPINRAEVAKIVVLAKQVYGE